MRFGIASWGGWSYLYGPFMSLLLLGVIVLLLRWAFSSSKPRGSKSLVARRPRAGAMNDYGLLVAVGTPTSVREADDLQRRLTDQGLTATVVETTQGLAVMVFPEDVERARQIIG